MVTFPPVGRMGNFLFECATAIAYGLKHNIDFTVPFRTTDPFWSPIYLTHLQNKSFDPNLEKIDLWENGHEFQPLPFEEAWRDKNIFIQGYRQSEKYFAEYRKEILYLFGFPYEKRKGVVSVHIRRGDYTHLRMKHPEVTNEWYELAMAEFPGRGFKFFSDDIGWCKQEFGGRDDCEFSTNSSEVDDLIEMASCEHNICSPSTFSWWGMWLNRNEDKKVIFPKFWFTEGWSGLVTSDIVPGWCIKL
jgi:hypothetical protein